MELKEQLKNMINEGIPNKELFLVDIIFKGTTTHRKVIILLDGDNGVSVADCAAVSRALSAALEENELFPAQYTLEVSSAGVDHPLYMPRQYLSRVGKIINLSLNNEEEVSGKLIEVAEDQILIDRIIKENKRSRTEELHVPFNEIAKAMVQVSFK